jgi:hypothetical protein
MDDRAKMLKVSALPKPFRTLAPHELEDILCIFKDDLAQAAIIQPEIVRRSWCN